MSAMGPLLVSLAINGAEVPEVLTLATATGPQTCEITASTRGQLAQLGYLLPRVLGPPAAQCVVQAGALQAQLWLPAEALPRRVLGSPPMSGAAATPPSQTLESAVGNARVLPSLQLDVLAGRTLRLPRVGVGTSSLVADYLPEPGLYSVRALPGRWLDTPGFGVLRLGPSVGRLAPGAKSQQQAQTALRLPWSPSGVFPQQGLGVAEVVLLSPTRLRLPGAAGSTLFSPGVYQIEALGLAGGDGLLALEAEDSQGQRSVLRVPVRAGARQMPEGRTAFELTSSGEGPGLTVDHGWRPGLTVGGHLAARPSVFLASGGNPQTQLALGPQSRLEGLWRLGKSLSLQGGIETKAFDAAAQWSVAAGLQAFASHRSLPPPLSGGPTGPAGPTGGVRGFSQLGLRQTLGGGVSLSLSAFRVGTQSVIALGLLWQPRGSRGLTQASTEFRQAETLARLAHFQPLPSLGPLHAGRVDLGVAGPVGSLFAQGQLPWTTLQIAAQSEGSPSPVQAEARSRLWISSAAIALRPAVPSGLVVHRFGNLEGRSGAADGPRMSRPGAALPSLGHIDMVAGLPSLEDPPQPIRWLPDVESLPNDTEWVGPPPELALHADQLVVLDHSAQLQRPPLAMLAPALLANSPPVKVHLGDGTAVPHLRSGMLHLGREPRAGETLTVRFSESSRRCRFAPPAAGSHTWLCEPAQGAD